VSDIDTATVDSLKALDPNRPIREADIGLARSNVRVPREKEAELGVVWARVSDLMEKLKRAHGSTRSRFACRYHELSIGFVIR
jgi:hypothetical protein